MSRRAGTRERSPVDERLGLVRWIIDLPIQPGEPRIFNASVKMANTRIYNPEPCYDNNGGSGLTREAARGAAVGEGIERYCATVYDAEDLIFGAARELGRRHRVAPPEDFALFHPRQALEAARFTEDTPIAWVQGTSLVSGEPVLVPACLVYMPYFPRFRAQGERVIGPGISTGLSCARSYEEALLGGLCEAVERDAFMITWLNRLPRARVDLTSSPPLRALYEERLHRRGLRYTLIDMATDIRLPSFACVLVDEQRSPPMICVGGATAVDPVRAAAKALLEAVQTREWAKFLGTGRTFTFAPDFSDIRSFEDHVALYAYGDMLSHVEFLLDGASDPLDRIWPEDPPQGVAAGLAHAVAALRERGVDAIAVELTTPDVAECGYRVTKVLAPALQPLDADYLQRFLGGARLYDVPRRLGFTAAETTLEMLNPCPHPYP